MTPDLPEPAAPSRERIEALTHRVIARVLETSTAGPRLDALRKRAGSLADGQFDERHVVDGGYLPQSDVVVVIN